MPQLQASWDPSLIYDLHHSSWQHWIVNPLSEARDGTCNLMVPSRIRFHCATMGTPGIFVLDLPFRSLYAFDLPVKTLAPFNVATLDYFEKIYLPCGLGTSSDT